MTCATRRRSPQASLSDEDIAKVRRALDIIQEAQNMVNAAAREICSVPGFAKQWSGSRKPYEAVKGYWYRLNDRMQDLRVPPRAMPAIKLPPACSECGCALDDHDVHCRSCGHLLEVPSFETQTPNPS